MIERMYFTIYIEFPYTPGYQLCILGPEIKDQDFFLHVELIKMVTQGAKIINMTV